MFYENQNQDYDIRVEMKISDNLLMRIVEARLLIHAHHQKINALLEQIVRLNKECSQNRYIPISLTEQKGDIDIENFTLEVLKANYERIPDHLRKRLEKVFEK